MDCVVPKESFVVPGLEFEGLDQRVGPNPGGALVLTTCRVVVAVEEGSVEMESTAVDVSAGSLAVAVSTGFIIVGVKVAAPAVAVDTEVLAAGVVVGTSTVGVDSCSIGI